MTTADQLNELPYEAILYEINSKTVWEKYDDLYTGCDVYTNTDACYGKDELFYRLENPEFVRLIPTNHALTEAEKVYERIGGLTYEIGELSKLITELYGKINRTHPEHGITGLPENKHTIKLVRAENLTKGDTILTLVSGSMTPVTITKITTTIYGKNIPGTLHLIEADGYKFAIRPHADVAKIVDNK